MPKRRRPKTKKVKRRTDGAFRVTPRNKPEVIDSHFESMDGKNWVKRPGTLAAVLGATRPEDVDAAIQELIKPAKAFATETKNSTLSERLTDCSHKLHAVRYHLGTIKREIGNRVNEFERDHRAGSGVAIEMKNPRLVYETEGFLFQVKSSIDLLVQALGSVIRPISSVHTFRKKKVAGVEHAGGTVINALRKNGFVELGDLFEKHRVDWIQELVSMRDTITHYSRLRGFHCFIEEPYKGGEEVTIHYPTMPSGVPVDVYCESIYDNLVKVYRSALEFFSEDMKPKSP